MALHIGQKKAQRLKGSNAADAEQDCATALTMGARRRSIGASRCGMRQGKPRPQQGVMAHGTALRRAARKGANDGRRNGMKDSHTRLASAQKRRSPHGKTGRRNGMLGLRSV